MAVINKSNRLHPYSKLHNTTMKFTGMSSLLKCFYSYNTKHSMLLTKQTADVNNTKDSYTTDTLPDLRQKRKGSGVKLVAPRSAHARAKGSIIELI